MTRSVLNSWQFWMGIAYFGLTVVVVALIVGFSHIGSAERIAIREQTVRVASATAAANSQYQQCLGSIPTLLEVNKFVRGVQTLHQTLLENAVATHRATPTGSPAYAAQIDNLRRLRVSVLLVSGIRFPVPSKATCAAHRRADLSRAGLAAAATLTPSR